VKRWGGNRPGGAPAAVTGAIRVAGVPVGVPPGAGGAVGSPYDGGLKGGGVMDVPDVRYVQTDDGVNVAYQVFGEGAVDLVFV
jgi:hypothetical protein